METKAAINTQSERGSEVEEGSEAARMSLCSEQVGVSIACVNVFCQIKKIIMLTFFLNVNVTKHVTQSNAFVLCCISFVNRKSKVNAGI